MFGKRDKASPFTLEDSLEYGWVANESSAELPVSGRAFFVMGALTVLVIAIIAARILFLGMGLNGENLRAQAVSNVEQATPIAAPRGIIRDRYGTVIAENASAFSLLIDLNLFLKDKQVETETLRSLSDVLGVPADVVYAAVREHTAGGGTEPLVIYQGLSEQQIIAVRSANVPALLVREGYERKYPDGEAFAAVLGYTSLANADDLKSDVGVRLNELVGRGGVESVYDTVLRGTAGKTVGAYDARGILLQDEKKVDPVPGADLTLTLDAGLQKQLHDRLASALRSLGRTSGVGLAMNPQTGEVLALVSFPTYDNNVFVNSVRSSERSALITDPNRPLFNRAVGGEFNPGSTVKPLVATAALAERVVTPGWTIFSPGYLDIPNPYDPSRPTRYVDWRYQGTINVHSAIAQSSNVYFYAVGGGIVNGIEGLGITRLRSWWERFHFGKKTGIDLPGEATGFLPSPEWKEKTFDEPWRLGDTYNVAIGQGDLTVTPIQLMTYISAIANGGTLYRPYVSSTQQPSKLSTIGVDPAVIGEVQRGMRMTVTSSMGTAHPLDGLPFAVAGKTGSAQILNNTKENAFFVGYAPYDNPQVAILILVEDAVQGSLNAVPVARDVLAWWYDNRVRTAPSPTE